MEKEKLEATRRQIAQELDIPIEKVQVYPYKPPRHEPKSPSPWETNIRATLLSVATKFETTPDKVTIHNYYGNINGRHFYNGYTEIKPDMLAILLDKLGGRNNATQDQ